MPKKHRAYWKGYLRLSLVTIAVEVYNAIESKSEISFRQIHKPTGKRVHYEKVVPGIGPIDNDDIAKGYEVDEDSYVVLEPEDIDALKLESKKTIDLVQFVDRNTIDYRYFERPYYIGPADPLAGQGYVVIRDALAKTGRVGLAQITIGGREWLVAIAPLDNGLVMEMLRYGEELREPEQFFTEVPTEKPAKEMIDLAVQLIEQKTSAFKPEAYKNHYQEALKTLVQQKLKGRRIVASDHGPRPAGANVIDLMEALKRSVSEKKATKPSDNEKTASKKAAKPRKRKSS